MVVIAKARDAEREEIALFMQEVFPKAKWGMDKWREVLSGRWSATRAGWSGCLGW